MCYYKGLIISLGTCIIAVQKEYFTCGYLWDSSHNSLVLRFILVLWYWFKPIVLAHLLWLTFTFQRFFTSVRLTISFVNLIFKGLFYNLAFQVFQVVQLLNVMQLFSGALLMSCFGKCLLSEITLLMSYRSYSVIQCPLSRV